VKQILTHVGGQIDNLTKEAVNSQYVQPMMAHSVPLSVCSKLMSLDYFCQFMPKELIPSSFPHLSSNSTELLNVLPAWGQSLRSRCTVQEVKRRVLDGVDCITPIDIQNYLESDYAKSAEQMLQALPANPSVYDYARC